MDMDDLLIKYLLGEAAPDEIARVEQWLAADIANRARYEQFGTIWAISRQTAVRATQDAGAALQRFRQRNAAGNNPRSSAANHRGQNGRNGTSHAPTPIRSLRLWRIAAVFAGILFIGGGTWYMLTRPKTTPIHTQADPRTSVGPASPRPSSFRSRGLSPWQQVTTGNTTGWVALPDNSTVTLNRHSSISYPSGNNRRGLTLRLKGEAFFSVTHDPSRPFIVEVNDVTIKVLGTSFEVRSVTGSMVTELVVETGAVRITRGKDSLILHAGEKTIVLPKGKLEKQPNRDGLYGYYLNRPLVCDSIPLHRVIEVLNQSYDAHVVLGRRELDSLPLTTVFHHEPLDKILTVIAATFDLSIVHQGQSIILK
jgi:transmembrane sensor